MVKYLTDSFSDAKFGIKELWWQKDGLQYNASGYGGKIPTRYYAKFVVNGRSTFHRVYAVCYSNVASFYVLVRKERYYVREQELEIARELLNAN